MSKIIGKCFGEYVKEEDVFYDPQTDAYKIKAGDRIAEIPGNALQPESLRALEEALSNIDGERAEMDALGNRAKGLDAKYRRACLGDRGDVLGGKTSGGAGFAGAPFGSQSQDPLRARVKAAGGYAAQDVALTAAAQKLAANRAYGAKPWGDPLRGARGRADDALACCDPPEPCRDPSAGMEVYYHDRFPSVPAEAVVDGAIELLNAKKNLHITKISFRAGDLRCGEMPVALEADHPNDRRLRRLLAAAIPHKAFDRAHRTDADRYAGLKAKLDTDTYIKLRIAYLLYQALKLDDADARLVSLDVFRVLASDTRQYFDV